jgi:hypothetical protein
MNGPSEFLPLAHPTAFPDIDTARPGVADADQLSNSLFRRRHLSSSVKVNS